MTDVAEYTHLPDWPIAVYQAVNGQIPFAPFVAYPLIPTVGKKGERALLPSVRCAGQTAEEAYSQAEAWIAAEIEKHASTEASRKAGAEKRRVKLAARSKAGGE
jgi:hypothetical protein